MGEGEFNVQETDFKGKNVTIQGSGYDKTTIKYGKTGQTGEYSGCYSFEGANVTFRDVTLSDYNGTKNYTGFIRVCKLNFENCYLNSMVTYAGASYSDDKGITTFNNCTYENDSDYLMWLYGVNGTYNFNNCLFKSATGKFFNAYHESNSENIIHINFTSCKFQYIGTPTDLKIYGYALLKNNQVYVLTITDCVDNFTDFNLLKDKVTEYKAGNSYSSQYVVAQEAKNGTKVVIDGNTVYEKK